MSGIITLTTDWGVGDPYAALFKALVWRQNPQAVFSDVSHQVKNSSLYHAAYLLDMVCWNYPEGSVHVVDCRNFTVDQFMQVRKKVRPLLFTDFLGLRVRGQYFLMENSGLLSIVCPEFEGVEEVVKLNECEDYAHYNTFNALNYYASAAARLSSGVPLGEFGETYPIENLQRLSLNKVRVENASVSGCICHIDAFGNLLTNIRAEDLEKAGIKEKKINVVIQKGMEKIENVHLMKRYVSIEDNDCFAVYNVNGYLEIGQKNVSLADTLYEDYSGIGDVLTLSV